MTLLHARPLRIENSHTHAFMIYEPTDWRHFVILLWSFILAKKNNTKSLTTHLPFEIQHPSRFTSEQIRKAKRLISFGELLKKLIQIPFYWENCPIVNTKNWELLYEQNDWEYIPKNISLCLDTGHLMMKAKNKNDARERIKTILKKRGKQIKHLHIHENNFVRDDHLDPRKRKAQERVLTSVLLKELQKNRTFIFEQSS